MSNKNTISGNTIIIKNAKIEISNTYLGFPQTYLLVEKMRRPNIRLMKELKELKDYHQSPVMEQLRKRKRHLEQLKKLKYFLNSKNVINSIVLRKGVIRK